MKFVLFYHSLVSDWNHGNAHFLRGIVSELLSRGHRVEVYEPAGGWSLKSLLAEQGTEAIAAFRHHHPELSSHFYTSDALDLDKALNGADVVIVHEWNEPALIARIGAHAAGKPYRLFFHDTHHRSVTDPQSMAAMDLRNYDGVLAFGRTIAERYLRNGWAQFAWIWHEAADARRFHPIPNTPKEGDLVWIGNWGDDERTAELHEFLIDPVKDLGLKARIHGVRYPPTAQQALRDAGIEYAGWIANYRAPEVFARYRCTVHVPRRAYASSLIGVPTIRMFETLACGIPLISAPWNDAERLFHPGEDYLVARDGAEMRKLLHEVLNDADLAQSLATQGMKTIRERHTCGHRVDELMQILAGLERGAHEVERLHASGG